MTDLEIGMKPNQNQDFICRTEIEMEVENRHVDQSGRGERDELGH